MSAGREADFDKDLRPDDLRPDDLRPDDGGLPDGGRRAGRAPAAPDSLLILHASLVFAAGVATGAICEPPRTLLRWIALLSVSFYLRYSRRVDARRGLRALAGPQLLLVLGILRGSGGVREGFEGSVAAAAAGPEAVEVSAVVSNVPVLYRPDVPGAPQRPRRTRFRTTAPALRVTVEGELPGLRPGNRVMLKGIRLPARRMRNPGDPSPRAQAPQVFVSHPGLLRVTEDSTPSERFSPFEAALLSVRERATRLVERLYSEPDRGVVLALLLGDRRTLPARLRDALLRTGTFHFFAISGLHIGFLMVWLSRLPLPGLLRLAAIAAFALVSGGSPPVVRAVCMAGWPILAAALGRDARALDTFGWTVMLVLFIRPDWILEVGFRLSAWAVLLILVWTGPIERALSLRRRRRARTLAATTSRSAVFSQRWPFVSWLVSTLGRWLRTALATSLAASLATCPLILHTFQRVHPLGPLWTIVLFPSVALVLFAAIPGVILAAIHPALGLPLAWMGTLWIHVLRATLDLLEGVPLSCVQLPSPPAWLTLSSVGLALAATLLRVRKKRSRPLLAAAAGAWLLALVVAMASCRSGRPRDVELNFLDVGAGSSCLLRFGAGQSLLVDAGSTGRRPGLGARLARSLLSLRVTHLDALILTHKDSDHTGAALDLVDRIETDRVLVTPYFARFESGRRLLRDFTRRGIAVESVSRGTRLRFGGGWRIEVLYPVAGENLALAGASNETSSVLRLTNGEHAAVLTADIEEQGTARLLSLEGDLTGGLLLFPHHGRANSLVPLLLRAVRPRVIVISAGREFASQSTLQRLRDEGYDAHATWEEGAVRMRPARGGWEEVDGK